MSGRRGGAPFFSARFLVPSCLAVACVPGASSSSVSVCRIVGALRSRLSFRSSARCAFRVCCVSSIVSYCRLVGRLVFLRRARIVVRITLSVIAHRVRASSPRSRRRYRDGCLVLRRWASSLVSCSIHIRAVFPSSVSRRRWAWFCPGSRCGVAVVLVPLSCVLAPVSSPCVPCRLVSASRPSARSSVRFVSPVGRPVSLVVPVVVISLVVGEECLVRMAFSLFDIYTRRFS